MLSACGRSKNENNTETSNYSSKVDTTNESRMIFSKSGDTLDYNGVAKDIRQKSGRLPQRNIIAPLSDSKGDKIKVETLDITTLLPGIPSKDLQGKKNTKEKDKIANAEMKVLSGRLNIVLDGDSTDIDVFAEELTKVFPQTVIEIVGIDRRVGVLQLRVPKDDRAKIKSEIEIKMGDWGILVSEVYLEKREAYREDNSRHGWHVDALCLKETWKITKGNPNTIIAIVDDGIDANHPMLKGKVLKPLNVFTETHQVSKGSGHGTHVAAIAAGLDDYYYSKGAAGVAPNCKIMPVQVFDNEYADYVSIATGIMDAIDRGAKIVNVSTGKNLRIFSGYSKDYQQYLSNTLFLPEARMWKRVCDYAKRRNAIIIFAAGNDNVVSAIDPHNRNSYSITVAAVDSLHKSTGFTNYGIGTDLSAYGEDIYSASSYGGYESLDGTSMAAPIVSGTIALMRAVKPGISAAECLLILQKTGIHTDKYTPVAVNPYRAVNFLQTGKVVNLPQKKQSQKIVKGINSSSYTIGKGVAVDLGLSVKWASYNLGSTKPEAYGNYYIWGETTTSIYNEWYYVDYDVLKSKGVINNRGNLTSRYDAATANWGEGWRMPTLDEIQELKNRCRWDWTSMNGVKGYKVIGPSGKSIFLPAAGYRRFDSELCGVGILGNYWSSTVYHNNCDVSILAFDSDFCDWYHYYRGLGRSIRPVLE